MKKKESTTQNLNSKNNVLIESKENYNIKWEQMQHNQMKQQSGARTENNGEKKNATNNINNNDNYYFNNKMHKKILIKTTAYDLNNKTDVDATEKIKTKEKQNKEK